MENKQLPWKATIDGFPEKPNKQSYEHIPCLVIRKGWFEILSWNCEENYWDDESGDDYECDALAVDFYVPLSEIKMPQP